MVKINWHITDDFSGISLEEFDNEWNGILEGYFELVINKNKIGFFPQKIPLESENGLDDVLHWLRHLIKGIKEIKNNREYEVFLMTWNRYKIVMKLSKNVKISFVNKMENMVEWEEEVSLQEFEIEVYKNVHSFLSLIEKTNQELMKSEWIKELSVFNFNELYQF